MDELWLVCEGEPDSVDAAVLKPIFANVLETNITVVAGSSSPANSARFLQNFRGGKVAYVLDRDYRSGLDAEAAFIDGTNGFLWRRHSIENYLLAPHVVLLAFERLRQRFVQQFAHRLPAWVAAFPTDCATIETGLRECAERRAPEEACRMCIQRLWEDLSSTTGRIQRRVPMASEPQNRQSWRDALVSESQRLRIAADGTLTSTHLSDEAITNQFDRILDQISFESYFESLRFLVDFHGRDLLTEFLLWLERRGIRLSYSRLINELIEVLPSAYSQNRALYGTDDFLDLANGVRAWAGLTPLK